MKTCSKGTSEIVAGADAARIGKRKVWAVVVLKNGELEKVVVEEDLGDLARTVELLAVDMPIGLPDDEGVPVDEDQHRRADVGAKEAVHAKRKSSVFWSPSRGVLGKANYKEARKVQPSLSAQAYWLRERICEVEALIADRDDLIVVEYHPEVTFAVLAEDRPTVTKKSWNGQLERRHLLARHGVEIPDLLEGDAGRLAPDDVLDAAAGALTAQCMQRGRARALGVDKRPGPDQRGVIWCPAD